jgi:hypothetical protein
MRWLELFTAMDQLYLFEKQPNAYMPQSMMACVCLASMLGNTDLRTLLPTQWQPGECTGVATT